MKKRFVAILTPQDFDDIEDSTVASEGTGHHVYSYVHGMTEAHFPVPAIRCGYEIGWSLSSAEPSLIYWEQGAYYD